MHREICSIQKFVYNRHSYFQSSPFVSTLLILPMMQIEFSWMLELAYFVFTFMEHFSCFNLKFPFIDLSLSHHFPTVSQPQLHFRITHGALKYTEVLGSIPRDSSFIELGVQLGYENFLRSPGDRNLQSRFRHTDQHPP